MIIKNRQQALRAAHDIAAAAKYLRNFIEGEYDHSDSGLAMAMAMADVAVSDARKALYPRCNMPAPKEAIKTIERRGDMW